jgi:hypothetical protein
MNSTETQLIKLGFDRKSMFFVKRKLMDKLAEEISEEIDQEILKIIRNQVPSVQRNQ